MKHLIFILLVATTSVACAQQTEFTQHSNGLIYSEATMSRLSIIVDSLNVRFRACDLSHPYYSYYQGRATWVELDSKEVAAQLRKGITPEEFEEKYPGSISAKNSWVIKRYYTNYRDERIIVYEGLPGNGTQPDLEVKHSRANDKVSGWIINSDETEAVYLHELKQTQLPFDYARLVQYVDCMIDTTATVLLPNAKSDYERNTKPGSKAAEFLAWANRFPNEPELLSHKKIEARNLDSDSVYQAYYIAHRAWDSLRLQNLDKKMKKDVYYKSLLADARQEVMAANGSNESFEFYLARYGYQTDALTLMRSRKVVGMCSQDQSPRYHAMNICMAAAETAQWDIFLRSHLNIMNDRFERVSDGSYAWGARKTYLRELEELDIPAVDLLLGTALRVSNVDDNHYWGNIGRTGRALADARNPDDVESRLLAMMANDNLDMYNRLLMAYVFDHYVHNLEDSPRKQAGKQKLDAAVKAMPEEIRAVWRKEK